MFCACCLDATQPVAGSKRAFVECVAIHTRTCVRSARPPSFRGVPDQPQEYGPESDEQRPSLGVPAFLLRDGLGPQPQADAQHDAADPQGILRAIRGALEPDGTYLCLEINCADTLEGNLNPLGALFYSFSVLLCMTTSLADGGAGLGTLGLPESRLRALAAEAGFGSVTRLPLENPFNTLYALKA